MNEKIIKKNILKSEFSLNFHDGRLPKYGVDTVVVWQY